MKKEIWKTAENVFDSFTLRTLQKLSSEGHFDGLKSKIAMGKEANVFTAEKGKDLVCIKIYRLETADFNKMYKYIAGDPRFRGIKHNRRKIIFEWTKREFRNLLKAREAGVNVPKPIAFENNVLVMEFIGDNFGVLNPAPILKNKPPIDIEKCFKSVKQDMKKMYKAELVHGDLSEYNILNYNEKFVLIDLSHGTPSFAPASREIFERDIKNVSNYFKRMGIDTDEERFRKEIVGK